MAATQRVGFGILGAEYCVGCGLILIENREGFLCHFTIFWAKRLVLIIWAAFHLLGQCTSHQPIVKIGSNIRFSGIRVGSNDLIDPTSDPIGVCNLTPIQLLFGMILRSGSRF